MQRYTVYFIWKLLYMFRAVPSPIIRSANNCIYSIRYLSHRYCYLPLSWKSWNRFECVVGGVNPNKMHKLQSIFCLTTALHVSRGTIIHHQERKQLYLQHPVFVTPLLPPAAIVEELEPAWVCCGWRKSQQDAQVTEYILSDKINSVTCASCWDLYTRTTSNINYVSQQHVSAHKRLLWAETCCCKAQLLLHVVSDWNL